jgi:RNA polymerase sigma factor (sigma-70 family)
MAVVAVEGGVTGGTGGTDEEFADWVQPSLLAMTRLARRLAPHADPDDVVQEALVRAWQKWHLFEPERGTATTWLLAIVADKARAARRAHVRRLHVVDDATEVPDASTAASADPDLERAITRLTDRQALAVQLHYFVGLSVAETAHVMDCAEGTVKSTLFDARTRLRDILGDDND